MTLLEPLREHLMREVFARAAARDPELIAAVERFGEGMQFVNGELRFTLPRLFAFVLADFERTRREPIDTALCDYKAFRRFLYQSQVNTELRRLGAIVVVERADDDHALSLYRLTRRPA